MIHWFWLVKLILGFLVGFVLYYGIKRKSKPLLITAGILLLLALVSPVKLDVNTRQQTNRANTLVQQSKMLPEKVVDASFKAKINNIDVITDEDLK